MIRKILFVIVILFVTSHGLFAQSGTLKGNVMDSESGEALPFANVTVLSESDIVTGGITNFEGKYTIKPIPAGTYTVKVEYVGYQIKMINKVLITAGKIRFLNFDLNPASEMLAEVEVVEYVIIVIVKI